MVGFFQVCGEVGATEIITVEDALLHRYANIEYLMSKPFYDGYKLIKKALENDRDDKLYQMWLVLLPNMTEKTYKPFSRFRDEMVGANIDKRSVEEIIAEAEEIQRRFSDGS